MGGSIARGPSVASVAEIVFWLWLCRAVFICGLESVLCVLCASAVKTFFRNLLLIGGKAQRYTADFGAEVAIQEPDK